MQYTYLAGVLLLLFFALMFLSERLWLKAPKKTVVPAEPMPLRKTDTAESRPKGKKTKNK